MAGSLNGVLAVQLLFVPRRQVGYGGKPAEGLGTGKGRGGLAGVVVGGTAERLLAPGRRVMSAGEGEWVGFDRA